MRRDDALAILGAHHEEIAAFGVSALSLFGSVARDEAGPQSDADLLVEFGHPAGLFTSRACSCTWPTCSAGPSTSSCPTR